MKKIVTLFTVTLLGFIIGCSGSGTANDSDTGGNVIGGYNSDGSLNLPNGSILMPGDPIPDGIEYGYEVYSTMQQMPEYSDTVVQTLVLEGGDITANKQIAAQAQLEETIKNDIFQRVKSRSAESSVDELEFIDMLSDSEKMCVFEKPSDLENHINSVSSKIETAQKGISAVAAVLYISGYGAQVAAILSTAASFLQKIKSILSTSIGSAICQYWWNSEPKKYILHTAAFTARYHVVTAYKEMVGPGLRSEVEKFIPNSTFTDADGIECEVTDLEWVSLPSVVLPFSGVIAYMEDCYNEDEDGNPINYQTPEYEINAGQFEESTSNKIQTGTETIDNPSSYGPPTITVPVYGIGSKHGIRQASSLSGGSMSTTFTPSISTVFPYIYYRTSASIGPVTFNSDYFSDSNTIYTEIKEMAKNIKTSLPQNSEDITLSSRNTLTSNTYELYERPETAVKNFLSGTSTTAYTLSYNLLEGKIFFRFTYKTFKMKRRVITRYGTAETLLKELNERNDELMAKYPFRTTPLISLADFYEWKGTQDDRFHITWDSTLKRFMMVEKGL